MAILVLVELVFGLSSFDNEASAFVISIVVGAITHWMVKFIGDIIFDSLSAVFLCNAVEKDQAHAQSRFEGLSKLISDVHTTKSASNNDNEPYLASV